MRQHLCVQDKTKHDARVQRIRKQVWELEGSTQGKCMLRLEVEPLFTTELDMSKGIVIEFPEKTSTESVGEKLLGAAIRAGTMSRLEEHGSHNFVEGSSHCSTNFGSAGKNPSFFLQPRLELIARKEGHMANLSNGEARDCEETKDWYGWYKCYCCGRNRKASIAKRKAIDEANFSSKVTKRCDNKVVPHEEPSSQVLA